MVHVVHAGNRNLYQAGLSQMHCDRKRIFFDRLHWKIPVAAGLFEIDQFDNDTAVYLLDLAPEDGKHLGSVRLLPTEEPHILGSLFSTLCDRAVPRGADIWEITRFCTAPGVRRDKTIAARQKLGVALAEFALMYGVSHYTCVAELPWILKLREIGWRSDLLGEPRLVNGELLAALSIEIVPDTLSKLRALTGLHAPVIELRGAQRAA